MQQLGRDAVEEGFGQLGLVVVGQQADVVQLGLLPGVHRQLLDVELAAQALHRLIDALVVERDALRLRLLLAVPVGLLEALLGAPRGVAEELVVAVEAVDQRLGDGEGAAVGQLVREQQACGFGSLRSAWRCHQRRLASTSALS